MGSVTRGATPGGKVLQTKSATAIERGKGLAFSDILVIEDKQLDADRLDGIVHTVLGYDVTIRRATTQMKGFDTVIARRPDLILLDDYLLPKDSARETLPFLRRLGYNGPIIVQSSLLTRARAAELTKLTATVCLHKDELNGTSFSEAIVKVQQAFAAGKLPLPHPDGVVAGMGDSKRRA